MEQPPSLDFLVGAFVDQITFVQDYLQIGAFPHRITIVADPSWRFNERIIAFSDDEFAVITRKIILSTITAASIDLDRGATISFSTSSFAATLVIPFPPEQVEHLLIDSGSDEGLWVF